MTMEAEVKTRWIEALRSGEFKQGKNYLERSGGNCCLGVLAKIEGVPMETRHFGDQVDPINAYGAFDFGTGTVETTYPPNDWKGLDFQTIRKLAIMNDDGKTFAEIADYIEEHL